MDPGITKHRSVTHVHTKFLSMLKDNYLGCFRCLLRGLGCGLSGFAVGLRMVSVGGCRLGTVGCLGTVGRLGGLLLGGLLSGGGGGGGLLNSGTERRRLIKSQ